MKLSYCRFNMPTLREEVLSMNKFNITLTMRKLVATMGLMFTGMTIPVVVLRACESILKYSIDGKIYEFSEVIPEILKLSTLFLTVLTKYVVMFLIIIAIFKSIKNNDIKEFGKEAVVILVGYTLIQLFKFIPSVVPNIMSHMGFL